jgi:8-oxo-dGTP pyrophosphatase MutT (NUDIX family)
VDQGEDVRVAALRELREETGVTSAEIISEVSYCYLFKRSFK